MQIGNAITEKMVLDVLLAARDRGLYHAITDCGAGGFSSAVGEMGEEIGAEVWLDQRPAEVRRPVATPKSGSPKPRSGWSSPCRRTKWPELRDALRERRRRGDGHRPVRADRAGWC